jgi:hypothetical protein
VPEANLLDLLSADHQNLLDAPTVEVAEVSQHLSVERDFLYPKIHHHLADGEAVVDGLRHAERQLEERLRDLEKDPSAAHQDRAQEAIAEHVRSQEELFTSLRQTIPESEWLEPLESIALSIGGAPTHAHPHLADGGLLSGLVEDITSAADHTFDRFRQKKDSNDG